MLILVWFFFYISFLFLFFWVIYLLMFNSLYHLKNQACYCFLQTFLKRQVLSNYVANFTCLILCLVITYSRLSYSMSSSIPSPPSYWWTRMMFVSIGLATWCSFGVLPLWVDGGKVVIYSLLVSSSGVSSNMKVIYSQSS